MITTNLIDNFKRDLKASLLELEKKYGVVANTGTVTYDNSEFRFKTIITEGKRTAPIKRATSSSFMFGDRVKVNHPKVAGSRKFTVTKVNRKSVKIAEIGGYASLKVSPSLLEKI